MAPEVTIGDASKEGAPAGSSLSLSPCTRAEPDRALLQFEVLFLAKTFSLLDQATKFFIATDRMSGISPPSLLLAARPSPPPSPGGASLESSSCASSPSASGASSPRTSGAYDTLTNDQSALEAFVDDCYLSTGKWQQRMQACIEEAFGTTRSKVEARLAAWRDDAVRRQAPPPAKGIGRRGTPCGTRITRKALQECLPPLERSEKCTLLRGLLVASLPECGLDARVSAILNELIDLLSLDIGAYREDVEQTLVEAIRRGAMQDHSNLAAQNKKTALATNVRRNLLVGLGVLAGGVAVGVSAGFAVPVVMPFLASLAGLSAGVAFLTTTSSAAILGVIFGAGGAGKLLSPCRPPLQHTDPLIERAT